MNIRTLTLTIGVSVFGIAAHAHELGEHPAVLQQRQVSAIDPNTFIVAHPAGGFSVAPGHANQEHPAVVAFREARRAVDPNTFIVQPPAPVTWTSAPAGDRVASVAALSLR